MQLNNLLGDIICIFFPVMFYVWLICFVCLHCHRGATSKPVFLSCTIRGTQTKPKLKDYLYNAFTSPYLPRYPCHLNREFRSLHRIPGLSILTGRCSARRSDPGRTSRCCCTARGSRLSTHHVRVKQPAKSEQGNQERGRRRRRGGRQERRGHLRVDRGRGGTKMI